MVWQELFYVRLWYWFWFPRGLLFSFIFLVSQPCSRCWNGSWIVPSGTVWVSGLQIPLCSDPRGPVPSVWLASLFTSPNLYAFHETPMTLLLRILNIDPNHLPETYVCVSEPSFVSQTLTSALPSLLIILHIPPCHGHLSKWNYTGAGLWMLGTAKCTLIHHTCLVLLLTLLWLYTHTEYLSFHYRVTKLLIVSLSWDECRNEYRKMK